jgi:REP-associated tyrosine transposase
MKVVQSPIDKESYLLEVCLYVVLTPVLARLVSDPEAWQWSSYRSRAGLDRTPACLSSEWILGQFGRSRNAAQEQDRRFVRSGIGNKTVWTGLRGQSILGREQFVEVFREHLEGKGDIGEIPRSQRYLAKPALTALFEISMKTKKERDGKIIEVVRRYGYSRRDPSKLKLKEFTS